MDIYFATTNKGKVSSLRRDMEPLGFNIHQRQDIQLVEPQSLDLEIVALAKARQAYNSINAPTVVNDAGFSMLAYNGFPGTLTALILSTLKLEGILKLAAGTDRRAEFRHVLAYQDKTLLEPRMFSRHVSGTIALFPRGSMQPHLWSMLSLIFIPDGYAQTLAEFSPGQYASWQLGSHREGSLLGKWLQERYHVSPRNAAGIA